MIGDEPQSDAHGDTPAPWLVRAGVACAFSFPSSLAVALNPRHHQPVDGKRIGVSVVLALLLGLLIAAVWSGLIVLVRHARVGHPAEPLGGIRAWTAAFVLGAVPYIGTGLHRQSGTFVGEHLGLKICILILFWFVTGILLRVIFALIGSTWERLAHRVR
jgi:hypothetical protein